MKEYMLFIKVKGNPMAELSEEKQQHHIEKIGNYIGGLVSQGKLKDAQPLEMEGAVVHKSDGELTNSSFDNSEEVIAGYYHILAHDIDEAVKIAKADPRFEDGDWRIEVRPILKLEGINQD